MWYLLAVGALGGLYLWDRRRGSRESPECDALDAQLEEVADRQNQIVANLAATADPAKQAALVAELAAQQTALANCEPWTTWGAE